MRADILWQIIGAILNRGAVLLSLILLSHQLTRPALGVYGYALNFTATLAAVAATGVGIELKKRLAQAKPGAAVLSGGSLFLIGLLVALAGIAGILLFAAEPELSTGDSAIPIIVCILVCSTAALNFIVFAAGGLTQFKLVNLLQSITALVFLAALVMTTPADAVSALFLYTAYMAVQLACLAVTVGRSILPSDLSCKWSEIQGILANAMPINIYAMSATPVFLLMQSIILGRFGPAIVGEVINATQLTNITNLVATQTLAVLFTRFAKLAFTASAGERFDQFARLHRRYVLLLAITVVGNLLAIPIFIALFAEGALGDIRWLVLLIIAAGINAYSWFHNEWLLAHGDVWFVAHCSIGWAAVCLLIFALLLSTNAVPALSYAISIIAARLCLIPVLLYRLKVTNSTA